MTNEGRADKNIRRLLGEIMAEVPAIPKGQRNEQQNYAFRGIDDVFNALHGLFAERGVVILPEVLSAEYVQQPLGQQGNLATDTRLRIRYHFSAPDGSTVAMTVIGESRDWADKATNQAMSAGYKTGLLQMFLIPLEETKDADAASPVGAPAETTKDQPERELTDEEIAERQVNATKAALVEIMGKKKAAAFWKTHQSLDPDELLAEARQVGPGKRPEVLDALGARVLGKVPATKGPLQQGITEMSGFAAKLGLEASDGLGFEHYLDVQLSAAGDRNLGQLKADELKTLYAALQSEIAPALREAQKAAADEH